MWTAARNGDPDPPPPPPFSRPLPQLTYSTLVSGLKADNVALNRRTLADLAAQEPASFAALCARVRAMRGEAGGGGGAAAP